MNNDIEYVIESIYERIADAGEACKGCIYNEVTENPSDYGEGKAYEVTRECTLTLQGKDVSECPGVRVFVTEIKAYAKKNGI